MTATIQWYQGIALIFQQPYWSLQNKFHIYIYRYSPSTRGDWNWAYFHSRGSRFWDMGWFSKYHIRAWNVATDKTSSSFSDNWGFWFLHRVRCWHVFISFKLQTQIFKNPQSRFVISRTSSALKFSLPLGPVLTETNEILQNFNCQNVKLPKLKFVRAISKTIQEKFQNCRLRFVGVAFWNFRSHRVSC